MDSKGSPLVGGPGGRRPPGGFQGSALTFLRSPGCPRPRAGADRRQTGGHMNATTFKSWLGQVTTGIGALIAAPVVIALLSAQITPEQAIPGIVAAVIGLIWPENK